MMAIVLSTTEAPQDEDFDPQDPVQLVRRAAQGDRRAWEGLIDKYGRLIWSITRDFKLAESDAAASLLGESPGLGR